MLKGLLTRGKTELSTANCQAAEDTAHIGIRVHPKEADVENEKGRRYWLEPSTGREIAC